MSLCFWKSGKFGHKLATELLQIKLAIAHPRADFHHLVKFNNARIVFSLRGAMMLSKTNQKQITKYNLLLIALEVINGHKKSKNLTGSDVSSKENLKLFNQVF